MYRRLLASVKGTKFGGATGSQRKAKIAKKPANQEIEDDSSVKNGKSLSLECCLPC